MSVYLGTYGQVELQRQFDGVDLRSTINPSDVNATKKRFSFDFEHGQLLSGDQVEITSTDGTALDFIDSYTKTSVKKFIHVDELDGIRLYDSFAHAVNGGTTNATALATPANDLPVKVKVENAEYKVLAQVNGFELNTERETVDTTTLSDEFRNRISTLMSGSGRMSAFWEYTGDTANELPNYLVELSLRTRVGSQFKARFYIKRTTHNPGGVAANDNDEVFYEFTGVLTGCAVQFAPDNTVQVQADFITTGTIQLRMDLEVPNKLLQEDTDEILLEQGTTDAILLDP
nr:phage major tail protein 2 [uncultured Mediterranean phage uvMED]BAR24231.1 phage major tail protein 2 [uncultured Mediterranean phage uvMED]BAR24257.1 phage major tail protein 2 [uncultured Mediterranean phage uvMED]